MRRKGVTLKRPGYVFFFIIAWLLVLYVDPPVLERNHWCEWYPTTPIKKCDICVHDHACLCFFLVRELAVEGKIFVVLIFLVGTLKEADDK